MLERMRAIQKRYYQHCRATHKFQVGDLVLLKKHNADKMDLQWEPNYRVIRLKSPWSVMVENQISGKTKCCNVGDLKTKHPWEDWTLKSSSIGRSTRFINHPDNQPDVDISINHDLTLNIQRHQGVRTDTRCNLRKSIKTPTKLNLWPCTHKKCKRFSKKERTKELVVLSHFSCRSINVDNFVEFLAFDEELNEVAQALDKDVAHLLPPPPIKFN